MKPLSILLLSGGGHTGANVMSTLAQRRAALRLIATSDLADEPALFAFDAVYLAPRLADDSQGFEARVLEVLEAEAIDLVIACRDEDVVWLAGLGERRPELASRLLCGSARAAAIAHDKWLSHEFCREHGLPFAPSFATGSAQGLEEFLAAAELPLVFKPRRGANAAGIRLLTKLDQARTAGREPDGMLQEFLGDRRVVEDYVTKSARDGLPLVHSFMGDKHSIQALIGPQGETASIACTRNNMTGRITRSITIDSHPEARPIGAACADAFARAGWRGPLNIQCQAAADGALRIHEFNARFTGATAARHLLGIDEVGLALRLFADREIGRAGMPACPSGAASESLFARAGDADSVARLRQTGRWFADCPKERRCE